VGTLPALFTALIGLGLLVAARQKTSLQRWRRHAAFIFLTLVIGPGFLVNTVLKDHWGRPRPKMVTEFRGRLDYQCFYEKGVSGQGKSFPCGHSSMGYYFVVLYFLARRRSKLIRFSLLAGSVIYGTVIGAARMAAGAHFASDVIWSAVIPCLAAWILYYFALKIPYYEDQPIHNPQSSAWNSKWLLWLAPPLAVATIAAVLLATPAFEKIEINETIPINSNRPALVQMTVASPGLPHADFCFIEQKMDPSLTTNILITGEVQGFGWPWNRIPYSTIWNQTNGLAILKFTCIPEGKFSELDGYLTISTPPGTRIKRFEP
jgi:membrane-associated phospholipid phosphatase